MVLLLTVSVCLCLEHDELYKRIYWVTSDEKKVAHWQKLIVWIEKALVEWQNGTWQVMAVSGAVTALGLYVLGLPYPLVWGVAVGVAHLVPTWGRLLASWPMWLVVVGNGGGWSGVVAVVFMLVVWQFEDVFLIPWAYDDQWNLSPLISLILVAAGFVLGGWLGAVVMLPIYVFVRSWWQYQRQRAGWGRVRERLARWWGSVI